mmetsp:Transcript_30613/g.55923  ORF Transcript_30613/g.55923 Transcript_30613/m.55923 type:complete len:408 (+) Transcript_30613:47-1270(+)
MSRVAVVDRADAGTQRVVIDTAPTQSTSQQSQNVWRRRSRTKAGLCSEAAGAHCNCSHCSHWAPKWRKLLTSAGGGPGGSFGRAPADFTEFDRTVRGLLNRISTENACRLLPLDPGLRGVEPDTGDSPRWWAARFSALMLHSYLQVVHTNRCSRGLAIRSADNVLPEYLDAMSPLLVRSPRLVTALMSWFARLLRWHDFTWPTTRLLLLAANEERNRDTLPLHSLGRLPADLIRGRILGFLQPPAMPAGEAKVDSSSMNLEACDDPGYERDAVAVLAHLVMFTPPELWRRLSACSFALVEAVLSDPARCEERQVYLAASLLATIAQRVDSATSKARAPCHAVEPTISQDDLYRWHCTEDLGPLKRHTALLQSILQGKQLDSFVSCRAQAALEHTRRLQERLAVDIVA